MRHPGRLYNVVDGEVVRLPSPGTHHLPFVFSPRTTLSLDMFSSSSDTSQPSSSSILQALFNTALQEYKDKTGCSLVDHPFAKQFQECDSVESITTILEEQARIFRKFRDHGKLVNSLKRLVDVLCSPFFTTVLEKGIDLIVRPKKHSLVYLVPDRYCTAIPACESNICWHPYPTHRMSLIL
jgi:hypothetical protein